MQKKASTPAPSKSAHGKGTNAKPAAAPAKAGAKAAPVRKTSSKATPTRSPAAKSPPVKGTAPKKAAPKKADQPAGKSGSTAAKKTAAGTVAKKPAPRPGKEVSKTVVAKKADTATATVRKPAAPAKSKGKALRSGFLESQRQLLFEERQTYIRSAEALKAQADSLALEHEPGDVQFDEEGGEGGTANVDREIDLYLSAQARATVVEIDLALQKIEDGTYGICESCGEAIPEPRLEALPYAALCVNCKSGGLSSRR